jgi:hypothetical protein
LPPNHEDKPNSANRTAEEQNVNELEPVLMGLGAYGSPDPRTSESVMLPLTDDPMTTASVRTAGAKGGAMVPDFNSMNKDELVAAAASAEIEGHEDMNKEELQDALYLDYLENTSKADLKNMAKALEIEGASKMNKEDLYAAVLENQGEGADASGEQRTNVATAPEVAPPAGGEPTIEEARRRGIEL